MAIINKGMSRRSFLGLTGSDRVEKVGVRVTP